MSKKILKSYFGKKNIHLAFERYRRSGNNKTLKLCKDYPGIRFFESDLKKNISDLSNDIINGEYFPSIPFKFLYPKKEAGLNRTFTILNTQDSIVFQCIMDKIAHSNYDMLKLHSELALSNTLHPENKYGVGVFSDNYSFNGPNGTPEFYFLNKWEDCWNKYNRKKTFIIDNHNKLFVLKTDISAFYDSISHNILRKKLEKIFNVEPIILDLLFTCLHQWSGLLFNKSNKGCGIPQGSQSSNFLAELFMFDVDQTISLEGTLGYYRYVDDFTIYGNSEFYLRSILYKIDNSLKECDLKINASKTTIEPLLTKVEKEEEKKKIEETIFDYEGVQHIDDVINMLDLDNILLPDEFDPIVDVDLDDILLPDEVDSTVDVDLDDILLPDEVDSTVDVDLDNISDSFLPSGIVPISSRDSCAPPDSEVNEDDYEVSDLESLMKNKEHESNFKKVDFNLKEAGDYYKSIKKKSVRFFLNSPFGSSDFFTSKITKNDFDEFKKQFNEFKYSSAYFKSIKPDYFEDEKVISVFFNVIRFSPLQAEIIFYFLLNFFRKNKFLKEKLWLLFKDMASVPFVQFKILEILLSSNDFMYSRNEIKQIYDKLENFDDVNVKKGLYLLAFSHINFEDQFFYLFCSRLKEECFYLKEWLVFTLSDQKADFNFDLYEKYITL